MDEGIKISEKKEDRRVRRTKKLLTQALTTLLEKKQINEITVKELTDLADMNRGTFYLYYKDIFDMLEKVEDSLFEGLDEIAARHEREDVTAQPGPALRDLFTFIQDNQDMCKVLLSPHGDMNFLHRLNGVLRERCLKFWEATRPQGDEKDFEYRYSFMVFGCAGLIRAWVGEGCPETPDQMAALADNMLLRGGLAGA